MHKFEKITWPIENFMVMINRGLRLFNIQEITGAKVTNVTCLS